MSREIAEKIPMDYEELRVVLHKLKMSQQMHRWINMRRNAGLTIPTSQEELMFVMHEQPVRQSKRERARAGWDSLKRQRTPTN
jgi:hypothetical protein